MAVPHARIALVGDRSPSVRAHTRIPALLNALAEHDGLVIDPYWIPTGEATGLDGFDGIWLVPGSPYSSEAGALQAAQTAREQKIPFLGTCGGFQHAVLEYARNVCGLDAGHAENHPGTADPVIIELACSLVGHEGAVTIAPGSLAERVLGAERTVERYHCSYGTNPAHLNTLRGNGLRFTGRDDDGDVRIAELPDHPFYLLTLFQPELAAQPHPVVRAFARAAAGYV
jgi:CTP synthase (UTP-ammonia lyase)